MLKPLFKKLAGWRSLKKTKTQVFSCEVCKISKKTFFTEHLRWLLLLLRWLLLYFFKKAISQPCYDVNNFLFSTHHWCIKSRTRLFINLSSIVKFSKQLRQGVPYKAQNWHAWSHEQYFSKHRFLDICRCAFNSIKVLSIFPKKLHCRCSTRF